MKTIVITGSIATGKSTASNYLIDLGYTVIDTDLIARQVVEPGSVGLDKIKAIFGESMIQSDGTLNRAALGDAIFNDDQAREQLNNITHPLIFQEAERQVNTAREEGKEIVFIDIPLFYEVDPDLKFDEVWLVYVPENIQLERLMARNTLSEEEAMARIKSQISIEDKRQKADVILDNSEERSKLYQQINDQLGNK
ncbi:dephospho-CoA kinase [Aerococcaceae bacterium DSM 111176]|nr:dephospho-CoA kinase [Aerococcaceae bacterium DSM 111176]